LSLNIVVRFNRFVSLSLLPPYFPYQKVFSGNPRTSLSKQFNLLVISLDLRLPNILQSLPVHNLDKIFWDMELWMLWKHRAGGDDLAGSGSRSVFDRVEYGLRGSVLPYGNSTRLRQNYCNTQRSWRRILGGQDFGHSNAFVTDEYLVLLHETTPHTRTISLSPKHTLQWQAPCAGEPSNKLVAPQNRFGAYYPFGQNRIQATVALYISIMKSKITDRCFFLQHNRPLGDANASSDNVYIILVKTHHRQWASLLEVCLCSGQLGTNV
jgi:hypothetical protein